MQLSRVTARMLLIEESWREMNKQEQAYGYEFYEANSFYGIVREAVSDQETGKSTEAAPPVTAHRDGSLRAYHSNGTITFGLEERSRESRIGAKYALYLAHDAYQDRSDLIIHRFDTYGRLRARGIFRQYEGKNIKKLWLSEKAMCWSFTGTSPFAQLIRRDLSGEEHGYALEIANSIVRGDTHEYKTVVDTLMRITPNEWEWVQKTRIERERQYKLRTRKIEDVKTKKGYLKPPS